MSDPVKKLNKATTYIQSKTDFKPRFGIILGTGLGKLATKISPVLELPYDEIPGFPVSTVESHSGKLIFGYLEGIAVVAMQGRFHYYEGYSMKKVTFPVRVLHALGIERLFISNAAGGLNPNYKKGDLMLIRDHINFHPENPLTGKNVEAWGPRFPDMFKAYDPGMLDMAMDIAHEHNISCHKGVYVSVMGPNLETPAEYNMLHIWGADAVGMSTVPEVIVARHIGLRVFAVSVITDLGYPLEAIEAVSIEEIIRIAGEAEPGLTQLMQSLIVKCAGS